MNKMNFIRRKSLDIFSQRVTPIEKYIIEGDKTPEHEISIIYLQKIIDKLRMNLENKTAIGPSSYKTFPSSNGNKANLINFKSQKSLHQIEEEINKMHSSDNEDIHYEQNISNSLDKKSTEFLLSLFNMGVCDDEIKPIELTKRQKQTFKLEDNNPYIYSFNKMHPFSMFYNTKYNKLVNKDNELELPAPNLISKEDWLKPVELTFDYCFEGIEINDKLGAVVKDPIIKKKFAGLVKDIIFQLLKVPFGHHISLNVKIFEPKTVLERYSSIFSYVNVILLPVCEPKIEPYERFRAAISFLVGGMHIGCQQLKPFNPFDGETFQGELPNGAKIYVENVTHKPLVARFYIIYKKKYEISGYWDLAVVAKNLGNEMLIQQRGPICIKFPEINECIIGHIPCIKCINATSQDNRAILFFGNMVFTDVKNKLKAVIKINTNKNIFHEVKGCTMKYDFPPNYKYVFDEEWEYGNKFVIEDNEISRKKSLKGKKKNIENYTIIDKIKGSYLNQLIIGEKVAIDVRKLMPEYIMPVKHCIPSDGRYREDLIWLFRSFYGAKTKEEEEIYRNISMEWKVMMEEFNRWERRRRAAYDEKLKNK